MKARKKRRTRRRRVSFLVKRPGRTRRSRVMFLAHRNPLSPQAKKWAIVGSIAAAVVLAGIIIFEKTADAASSGGGGVQTPTKPSGSPATLPQLDPTATFIDFRGGPRANAQAVLGPNQELVVLLPAGAWGINAQLGGAGGAAAVTLAGQGDGWAIFRGANYAKGNRGTNTIEFQRGGVPPIVLTVTTSA